MRLVSVLAVLAIGVAACSSGKEATTASRPPQQQSGKVTIAYLQKQGDQEYFIGEANGARDKAKELGVDLQVVDLGEDTNKAVSETQAAIGKKVGGIVIVVPAPAVGPQVVQLAKDAGIPLLTSDDQVCVDAPDPSTCAKDKLVPRVGFSGTQMGEAVGTRAGEEFKKAGWKKEDTAVITAWQQDVTVCTDRVKAAVPKFEQAAGISGEKVIEVGTDNTPTGAQDKVAATISGNRGVKNWVILGCNDENVSGGVTAMQNAGIKPGNIIGVGLGAYLACKDWNSGKPTGMKAALFINGYEVGKLAVQTMYDNIKSGKTMPPEAFAPTKMVDPGNWQAEGVKCSA
ncbi:substrate-binding domain-containing protein [Nonomuraea sediminis]|uniref:substrate-binding domain-containing protein n=1 Tax=Nonomuraea sediminis TaxID=2835864 RepID=UPI001BDD5900|nr:substrate-binding domain-containing protein [Nonomuraea sediminis]